MQDRSEAVGPSTDRTMCGQGKIGQPTRWAHRSRTDGLYGNIPRKEPVQRASLHAEREQMYVGSRLSRADGRSNAGRGYSGGMCERAGVAVR